MGRPTPIVGITGDKRLVETDLRYDMSGTRIYKRDYGRQVAAPVGADGAATLVTTADNLVSDRETYYLANGTEVLMEVETRGLPEPNREGDPQANNLNKAAPDRYTAYIFGAGSRLARISWDNDGRAATGAGQPAALQDIDFQAEQAHLAAAVLLSRSE